MNEFNNYNIIFIFIKLDNKLLKTKWISKRIIAITVIAIKEAYFLTILKDLNIKWNKIEILLQIIYLKVKHRKFLQYIAIDRKNTNLIYRNNKEVILICMNNKIKRVKVHIKTIIKWHMEVILIELMIKKLTFLQILIMLWWEIMFLFWFLNPHK